jgi:NifU-like protein involved in Fe-S cluster formation
MSNALNTIYDALLMRHIREAHRYGLNGFGEEQDASAIEISNPLCGDTLTLKRWRAHESDQGMHLSFECECCGIAMGSASLMTLMMDCVPVNQARALAETALAVLRGEPVPQEILYPSYLSEPLREDALGGWQLLSEISQNLPSRRTCASLAWQALLADLEGQSNIIAIEVK